MLFEMNFICVLILYYTSVLIELDSPTIGMASKTVGHVQAFKYKQNSVFKTTHLKHSPTVGKTAQPSSLVFNREQKCDSCNSISKACSVPSENYYIKEKRDY